MCLLLDLSLLFPDSYSSLRRFAHRAADSGHSVLSGTEGSRRGEPSRLGSGLPAAAAGAARRQHAPGAVLHQPRVWRVSAGQQVLAPSPKHHRSVAQTSLHEEDISTPNIPITLRNLTKHHLLCFTEETNSYWFKRVNDEEMTFGF